MNIKEYIENNESALVDVRCSSCSNSLIHCGNYSISTLKLEGGKYEGLLCQDCLRANRKVLNAIIISEDGNKISYIELPKEQPLKQKQEAAEKPKSRVIVKTVDKKAEEKPDSEKESE